MKLIEPDEQRAFLAALQRSGLAVDDFQHVETDTTDPKGDENFGLQGYVDVTRRGHEARVKENRPLGGQGP